jgi:hypothetical protein
MATGGLLARLEEEGREVMADVEAQQLRARLIGGMAIRLLLGPALPAPLEREVRDLDLVVARRDARALEALLAARGWAPHEAFNALNGARRMLFLDPESEAQVDVFVDAFEMCHALPLSEQLDAPGPALPATELVMTKLQIVRLNAKDRGDLYALLGAGPPLEPERVAALTARDWGLHHTFELNLARLREQLGEAGLPADVATGVDAAIATLAEAMEAAPKSRGWRMRAKIGERKQWYQEPEEVDRD